MGKTINFKEFLEKNEVDIKLFIESCLEKNHSERRGQFSKDMYGVIANHDSKNWIDRAFPWEDSLQKGLDLVQISSIWRDQLLVNKGAEIKSGFPKYSIKGIYDG